MKYFLSILVCAHTFALAQTKISYYPNGKKEFEGNYKYVNPDAELNYTNPYSYPDDIPSSNPYYFTSSPKAFDGPCTMWFDNGNKKLQGNYNLGIPDGKFTYWYENGKLKAEGEYKLGFKNGHWKEWYRNGNLRTECNYLLFSDAESDSMFSDEVFFKDNPATQDNIDIDLKQYEDYFDTNSKKDGKCVIYYENGSTEFESFYTNNIKQGEWKCYYPNGILKKTYSFKDGAYNGFITIYKADGSKLIEKNMYNNDETILNVWDKSGEQIVKNGKGKFIDYDELGNKVMDGNIVNGKLDGIWSYYRLDGSVQSISNYQNGILLSSKIYDYTGELEQEQLYKNNKLKVTKYYEKGKVVDERIED